MTNYEAIKADLLSYTASRLKIEKELLRVGLIPGETFKVEDSTKIATVVIKILRGFISLKSESEGGLSNSYDTGELKKYLLEYAKDYEVPELVEDIATEDTIRDRSDSW